MTEPAAILFYLLLLILPISALVAHRVPAATWIRYGAIWIAIFGVGAAILYVTT